MSSFSSVWHLNLYTVSLPSSPRMVSGTTSVMTFSRLRAMRPYPEFMESFALVYSRLPFSEASFIAMNFLMYPSKTPVFCRNMWYIT